MEQKKIENKFANDKNMYYAHGIGSYDEKVVNSIFKYGIRCSHNELYWTVVGLGEGSETLFRDNEERMSNWKHKDSKHIIIASLPKDFHLLDIQGTSLFQKRHSAFYNSISPEQARKFGINPGLYLKPEFVIGMYDTIKKDFVTNDRYYENLSEEEQKRVLDEVKKQYIDIIEHSDWTLAEYAQILEDMGIKCPLTQEEMLGNRKVNEHQYEENQGTIMQSKSISIVNVKESTTNGKVTSQEAQCATQDIRNLREIKKLQRMQESGELLTKEQKMLLDEHIKQTQQAQIQFHQRHSKLERS